MKPQKDILQKKTETVAKETPLKQNRFLKWKDKLLALKNSLKERFPARRKYFRAPQDGMSSHHTLWIIISEFALFVCLVSAAFYFRDKLGIMPIAEYGQSYALVGEKLSANAPITINLPAGMKKAEAMKSIAFNPAIKGEWKETVSETELVWKPAESLALGKYYTVNLDTETTHLSDDFLADENPRIEAIFPSEASEVNENSNITIIFNRPMVPMTALSELEKKDLPIALSPETEGKWKWISTRNVQFIPNRRLLRSTNYTVVIGDGLVSMDGLPVAGRTNRFTVRPLRYVSLSEGQTLFNRPISLSFNQPVDIEKTMREISVINGMTGANIPLVAEYAITRTYDKKEKRSEEFINRSVINVYPKEDRLGRARLWDFNMNYQLTIKKAYPIEGDVILNEARSVRIQVPEIISSVSAASKRLFNADARPDMFDPEGELIVAFYEEIDRGRSKITAKGLKSIEYGEKCLEDNEGNIMYLGSGECEKGENKNILILRFDGTALSRGENIPIDFEEIYNASGLKVNAEKITKTITTYPALVITKTIPSDNQKKANLTEFIACSNTPIKSIAKEEYAKSLITSGYMVFGGSEYSIYIEHASSRYHCRIGEYETRIRYGLLPETKYSLTVKFEDAFLQKADIATDFTTSAAESQYTRFYNMQKAYNVTPPGKTKLTYAVENLEYVNLHICKLPPEDFLKTVINQPDRFDPPSSSECDSAKTDIISLPKRYWVNNYFQMDIAKYFPDTIGHYIVTFSNPKYREEEGEKRSLYDRTYVSVTRLAVGEKKLQWNDDYYYSDREQWEGRKISKTPINPGQNLYWVSRFNTFQPMAGAVIFTYTQEKKYNSEGKSNAPILLSSSIVTGSDGIAKGNVTQNVAGVVVKYGQDSAIITPWADTLLYTQSAQNAGKTYLYTDRPIYRPGQEVFFKGIDRVGYDGTYEVFREKNVKVKVYDSRDTVIHEQDLPISEYGTFSASAVLKNDAPLGTYRISAFGNSMWFEVEEYAPSAFKVDVASDKPEYIAGETMKFDVDAQYYFGVPVGSSEVSYTVTSQDYYFDRYRDEYFNFGNGWYSCRYCGYGDRFLFRGKTETDENGKARIEQTIDFSQYYKDESAESSKIFVVDMTVKDSSGRSVSAQKSFIVHRGKMYLGVKTDDYSAPKNKEFGIRGKSVDTEGKPIGVSNIALEINKITWEVFKRREVDGGFYYRSEEKKKPVKKEIIGTDGKGNWSGSYSLAEEGEYEIKLSAKDSLGNTVTTKTNMYVYGNGNADVRPTNNATLEIETEKLNVSVGDNPKIIIKSPYKKAKALITTERGKVFEYHIADIDRNLFDYTIPIKAEYAPNIFVSVLLLSDGPEIKFGQLEFSVNAERHALKVEVVPDKKYYLPGEKVSLSVKTADYAGKPVSADVSLAVADLSVLALKGNPKKNPLVFFYDGFPLTVTTASNVKNILEELDIPVGTKGGGGGADENLAAKKRGEFKDTAFWEGSVITDDKGKASVSFTLSDNLTTWQVEALGVTEDTLLGVDYQEIVSQKRLMTIPQKPRFIVPGDEFSIGAKVFNQTDKREYFKVAIQSATLEILEDKQKGVSLDKGETGTVYFKVKAPATMQTGLHSFTLSAKGANDEDTVENTIPITKNNTYETTATANFTKLSEVSEYVFIPDSVTSDEGGLTINANATMAVFLSDALKYLSSYPYGCSEQLAGKLSSIGTVQRGLQVKNVGDKIKLDDIVFEGKTYTAEEAVRRGLGRLYESQLPDGGFSYYPGLSGNFHLTLHVVRALENLRKAGFEVNTDSLNRASSYLYSRITTDYRLNQDKDLVILTAYTLSDAEGFGQSKKDELQNRVRSYVRDRKFLNEDIGSLSLAYFAILAEREGYGRNISDTVFAALENRIDTDGRGAYLKENPGKMMYQAYETRAGDTAILLKAITVRKVEHPLTDKIVRWLLRSRDKDGAWGSTNATLVVIDAMTDYLNWQKETESDFSITGFLDGARAFGFDFNKDTVLDTFTKFLPIKTFPQNKTVAIKFKRENRNQLRNNFYYDMSLKYFLPVDKIAPRDEGITLTRELYALTDAENKKPVKTAKIGDVLRGKLTIILPKAYEFVSVEDIIPAGFEIVNFKLSTEDQSLLKNNGTGMNNGTPDENQYGFNGAAANLALPNTTIESNGFFKRTWLTIKEFFVGQKEASVPMQTADNGENAPLQNLDEMEKPVKTFRPDTEEVRDDRIFLFKEHMSEGVYEYEYYIRALVPGTFHHLPARAEEMYFPEVFGRTEGAYFEIKE